MEITSRQKMGKAYRQIMDKTQPLRDKTAPLVKAVPAFAETGQGHGSGRWRSWLFSRPFPRRVITSGLTALTLLAPIASARSESPVLSQRADSYVNRLELLALLETLNADLLAARSATRILETWCADHRMAAEPKIHARLVAGANKEISEESRRRLGIDAHTPVKYRRVELTCGDHILSQADNWYVPERLTPAMNEVLQTTDTPFGYAVKDLAARRQNVATTVFWRPLPEHFEMQPPPADHADRQLAIPELLFEHRALLVKPDGQPFSEVVETYRRDLFDFAPEK